MQSSKRPGKRSKAKRRGGPPSVDHIDDFFAEYSDFDYDSAALIWTEFNRMCDDFEREGDVYKTRVARRKFKSAMA